MATVDPNNPQSWNRYAYVLNNPTALADPFGLYGGPCPFGQVMVQTSAGGSMRCEADVTGDNGFDPNYFYFGHNSGGGGGGNAALPPDFSHFQFPETCLGQARVLQGNSRTIGRSGAFWPSLITAASAVVDYRQFGFSGSPGLRPYIGGIWGSVSMPTNNAPRGFFVFGQIGDVIGGVSPIKGLNVRMALGLLYPGTFHIELPGIPFDPMIQPIVIHVPPSLSCPEGTGNAAGLSF